MCACMCEFVRERARERESIRVWLSTGLFRESSKRNYYIISPRVLIKAIFIIGVDTSLFRIIWSLFRIDRALFGIGMALFRIDRALLSVYIGVCVCMYQLSHEFGDHTRAVCVCVCMCVRVCVYVHVCVRESMCGCT